MLFRVYLDPRQASSTAKYAESGKYEPFVVVNHIGPQTLLKPILANFGILYFSPKYA